MKTCRRNPFHALWQIVAVLSALSLLGLPARAADTTPTRQLQRFEQAAQQPGNAQRGATFFNQRHTGDGSCASCHGPTPIKSGQHASTGKLIEPLAPSANPRRFTDEAKVDKWFRRNCKDVLQRECSELEKADVLAFLIQQR